MILFFDCETNGMPDFKAPDEATHQPRIVQLAALLTDAVDNYAAAFSTLIEPEGWEISERLTEVHGITTEKAAADGVPIKTAMEWFEVMVNRADTVVAHNIGFDHKMTKIEAARLGKSDPIADRTQFCTMKASTDLCMIPGRFGFKWPSLTEAHKILLGTTFNNAHDALADVQACKRIYFAIAASLAALDTSQ